jgi:hypothetical protein
VTGFWASTPWMSPNDTPSNSRGPAAPVPGTRPCNSPPECCLTTETPGTRQWAQGAVLLPLPSW